jgi:signal transduction histidine kinase
VPLGSLALFTVVATVFGSSPFEGDPLRSSPFFGLVMMYVAAGVTVGILFRRYVPHVTAAICAVAVVVSSPGSQSVDAIPMMFALYALAVYRSTRSAWVWTAVAVGAGVAATVLHDPGDIAAIVGYGFLFALLMVIATLVGITFGNRRRYIIALLDRAEQLARERDQRAQLAASAERTRIAREMHDIVAHSLTVIVALSDGAEASIDRAPDSAREAVRQTGITARRALADMRRSLGVLAEPDDGGPAGAGGPAGGSVGGGTGAAGDGGADARRGVGAGGASMASLASPPLMAPQPGLDDLGELVQSYRAAGLPVRFTVTGEAGGDPLLQLTVYRVVQEALTNALRYAVQVTRVDVVVAFEPGTVRIEVDDDGIDPGRGASSTGTGRGLIGMRERVAVHDGTVTAGPAGSRGWRVEAVLRTRPDEETR